MLQRIVNKFKKTDYFIIFDEVVIRYIAVKQITFSFEISSCYKKTKILKIPIHSCKNQILYCSVLIIVETTKI